MKRRALSEQEQKALDFFHQHLSDNNTSPSVREVGEHLGLNNSNNAKPILDRLVRFGLLDRAKVGVREPGRPRSYTPVIPDRRELVFPYRGCASCGSGVENGGGDETIDLHDVFPDGDGLAFFKARGDSMIDAHIADGDLLMVQENPSPEEGEVVVAMLDRDLVCKRLALKSYDVVRLESCNESRPPLEFNPWRTNFRFLGVLRHVVRKVK